MWNKKNVTDKAWAQMRVLLDEEMPQRKERQMPFGWWATAAAVVVLIGSLIPHYHRAKNARQSASAPIAAIASVPVGATAPKHTNAADHRSPAPQSRPALAVLKSPAASPDRALPTAQQEAPPAFAPTPPLPERTLRPATTLVAALPTPPVVAVQSGSRPVVEMAVDAPPSTVRKAPRPLRFGLLAGANTLQVKQMPGFLGGLTLDLSGKRQRFGLQTGLIYRYQVFSGESRPVIPVTYDRYMSATNNDDLSPANLQSSNLFITFSNRILVPVTKSHQIEAPLLLYWQVLPRWRAYGGATFMRHVWIEGAQKALFTYDLRVVTTPDDRAAGNLNNEIKNQLPAWEQNWQAGLSFSPWRRFEIGVFYRSTIQASPALSDTKELFDRCYTCNTQYPAAKERTGAAIRPHSLQLNLSYKF